MKFTCSKNREQDDQTNTNTSLTYDLHVKDNFRESKTDLQRSNAISHYLRLDSLTRTQRLFKERQNDISQTSRHSESMSTHRF